MHVQKTMTEAKNERSEVLGAPNNIPPGNQKRDIQK